MQPGLTRCSQNRAGGKTAHEPDPGSVLDLTQALVSEWEQIPAAGSTCGGKTHTRKTEADTLTPMAVVMFAVHILLARCSCSDHGRQKDFPCLFS